MPFIPQAFNQNKHPPWLMWTFQSSWTFWKVTFSCSVSKNFNILGMFIIFPKLIHFCSFFFSYNDDNILIICLDFFVQGKLANLERTFEFLSCNVKDICIFHISINLVHFLCIIYLWKVSDTCESFVSVYVHCHIL